MHASFMLKDRSNRELLAEVKDLVGQECNTTALLIAHLSEIELRGLHLEEGCPSLFKYCTEVLHLSESAAYRRIDVARVARDFPVIFQWLAEGSVNLTTVLILGPCLTEENHRDLLEAAQHKSKEEVERLAVAVRPRPDAPSVIRKLPDVGAVPVVASEPRVLELGDAGAGLGAAPLPVPQSTPRQQPLAEAASTPVRPVPSQRPVVSPLSPERYKIQFTANVETHRKLRQLQELLRHQVPNGDIAVIIDRGLTLLLEQVTREKLAQVTRPRKPRAGAESGVPVETTVIRRGRTDSRHVPAEVKRSVWQRDGGQCAFVSKNGRRCSERGRLEFHHVEPFALGGEATQDNIALRCRGHNAHEGELVFGARVRSAGGRDQRPEQLPGGASRVLGETPLRRNESRLERERQQLALERVSRQTSTINAGLNGS
jgi:5-methylcytosine-specific restriction endonuclease McrA